VYDQIVQYLVIEGYPTEVNPYFNESSISDLVYSIISPIIFHFILKTGRDSVQLLREKEIVSRDGVTGGSEEFVVLEGMDQEKELWMEDYSVLVDCMYAALSNALEGS